MRISHGLFFAPRRRDPVPYLIGIALVIVIGLGTRRYPEFVPDLLGKSPGDALWALMVYLALGLILRRGSVFRLGSLALAFCWAVEFSQLYQAPWINEIRSYRLGHLALGSAFHWPDLPAYAVGVACGVAFELWAGAAREKARE